MKRTVAVIAATCVVVLSGCVGQTAVQRTYEASMYYSVVADAAAEYAKLPTADAGAVKKMAEINALAIDANKEAETALQLCLDEKIIKLKAEGWVGKIDDVKCENAEAAMIGATEFENR